MSWFGPDPEAWRALAVSFALAPYAPVAGYSHGCSFRQLKRSLGRPAPLAPSFQHWLYGTRRGVEVIVLVYEVGSGSSTTTYTGVLARVDPPLFFGLGITAHGFFDGVFGRSDLRVGHPFADEKLKIDGADGAGVAAFLSPGDPAGHQLLASMVGIMEHGELCVSDSLVAVSRTGTITDPRQIGWMMDAAVGLATALAARRATFPYSRGQLAQQAEWQRFADGARFELRPAHMMLRGERAGAAIEIALETELQQVRTAITVRFPHEVGVAFTAIRTRTPAFLQGIFSQDIKIGDPDFDALYLVTGHPEAAVRDALGRPALVALLTHLGQCSTEVIINPLQLFVRLDGAAADARELERYVEMGRTATETFFGQVKDLGPYR